MVLVYYECGIKEAWLSGLKQHPAKMLIGKPIRRFESSRLRITRK